jgi:phage protein D
MTFAPTNPQSMSDSKSEPTLYRHSSRPTFEVIADGKDITALIADRVESINLSDESGLVADCMDITLDDRDFMVAVPPTGAVLKISIGYESTGVFYKGSYTVDEIEASGPPNKLVLRGKSADMAASMKSQRKQSWSKTTLGKVLEEVAARNKLKPAIGADFMPIKIEHLDQTYESDLNLITRLAEQYGALAKPSAGYLVFVKKGASVNAQGAPMPIIDVDAVVDNITRWQYSEQEREFYGSVRAFWNDKAHPKKDNSVTVGDKEPVFLIKTPYKDEASAKAGAQARYNQIGLGRYSLSLDMLGNPLLQAEATIMLTGVKPEACGAWVINSVQDALSSSYTSSIAACRPSDFVRAEEERKAQEAEQAQDKNKGK